jgi:predicted Zn finger-like uncharacterized protein
MTLATRCPACATVFRVVQDQLRVSEGWVRCGRCSEVFNAVDQMVELPASAGLAPAVAGHEPAPQAFVSSDIEIEAAPHIDIDPIGAVDEQAAQEPMAALHDLTEVSAAAADATADEPASATPPDQPVAADAGEIAEPHTLPTAQASAVAAPSFLQVAERAQRWQSPALRRGLAAASAVAVLALTLQVMMEYRDLIAARWDSTRAPLELMCRWAGCRIEPPRMIDALVVDSSGLTRVEGTNTYRFALVLRNRAALELAMPAVDLVLTDSQGRVISRRVLKAGELGTTAQTVGPNAEFSLQATLAVAEQPVAGYTIEVFYP